MEWEQMRWDSYRPFPSGAPSKPSFQKHFRNASWAAVLAVWETAVTGNQGQPLPSWGSHSTGEPNVMMITIP